MKNKKNINTQNLKNRKKNNKDLKNKRFDDKKRDIRKIKKNKKTGKQTSFCFNLKNQFIQSLNYLKVSKDFIFPIIIIFFIFVFMGFFFRTPELISNQILEIMREILEKTQGMSAIELISFIFFNNLVVSLFSLILGIALGIVPIFVTITNGYILGFVAKLSVESRGLVSLWMLLPHGIFELPAIFISLGLGLKAGSLVFRRDKENPVKKEAINIFRTFIFIVVPLLIIAAVIEGILIYYSR